MEPTAHEKAFALAHLVWADLDDAPGEIVDDPATLKVGDVVVTRGHGRYRAAVVTAVGRKNAKAVFTTPGAIDQTERVRVAVAERWANLAAELDQAEKFAAKNFDFYLQEADPATRKYGVPNEYRAAAIAGGREAFLAKARADREAELARLKADSELPLLERVLFTAATVKPGQAKFLGREA